MGRINYKGERATFNNWDAPVEVSLTDSSARTAAALTPGNYIITCDVDCAFIVTSSTGDAATTDRKLWAKTYRRVDITSDTTKQYVAAILASGTGTLSIERVDQD